MSTFKVAITDEGNLKTFKIKTDEGQSYMDCIDKLESVLVKSGYSFFELDPKYSIKTYLDIDSAT